MKNKKGFTLLELLIAVAIIAILVAIALPRYLEATNRAKTAADKGNMRLINAQIELYQLQTGYYPVAPGLPELLNSASYFPDGPPECPFLKGNTSYPTNFPSSYKLNICADYIDGDSYSGDDGQCSTMGNTPRIMRVIEAQHKYVYSSTHENRWVD